jgi:hypothetical protein
VDPNAPVRHTLPSGRVVEVRSTRSMTGADSSAVLAAQSAPGATGVIDMYNALIARMVTQVEPGSGSAPDLDGTLESVLAQRIDDHSRLRGLIWDAYQLVTGRSVIPDEQEWMDPTAPTRDGPDSKPPSEADGLP